MASNKRTIYLGLDYSQFTGGVTEINRKMGLLDAEFKLATTQAKNYGTETDQLGLKTEYLTQKIALQNQKVEEAKKAYDDAMSSQSASAKEIDELDKKLLKERTTLEQLNGELKDSEEASKKADEANKSFGDEIRGVAESLGLKVSPALEKLAKKFDGVTAAVGNAVIGIGAMVGGLVSCSKAAAEDADELLTLASTTGLTTEQLQKMRYASDFVDVSLDTMTSMTTKLEQSMINARKGTGDVADAFKKLHIRTTDTRGALRDQNEVFLEAIDALGKVKNSTERDALAMQLFGKSAKELNPLIEKGSQGLNELYDEAERLGVVMGEDDVAALGNLNDAFDRWENTTQALKNSLGLTLLPILTDLFDAISNIPVPVLKTLVILASIIASIVLVVKAIKSMTDTAKTIKNFFSGFSSEGMKTTLIIVGVVAALIALAAIIAVIIGKGDELGNAMNTISKSTQQVSDGITGAQQNAERAQSNVVGRNARGTDNWQGGDTWVGEEGPELVSLPRGTKITPADQAGGTVIYYNYITIDAKNVKDFNDVVNLMNQQKMALRRT